MLAQQGNTLDIGPRLDGIADSQKLKRRSSDVRTLAVPSSRAATMFHMNFSVWRQSEFIQRSYEPAYLDELENGLSAIASGRADIRPVEWGLRHIVMERVA